MTRAPPIVVDLLLVALLIVVGLLLVALGVQTHRVSLGATTLANERLQRSQERASLLAEGVKALEDARKERDRILSDQRKATDAADKALAKARAARASADDVAGRLRTHIASLAAACNQTGPGAAAAEPGSSASAAGSVLADMLGRVTQRAGELAAYADQARIAGQACEASFDSLVTK